MLVWIIRSDSGLSPSFKCFLSIVVHTYLVRTYSYSVPELAPKFVKSGSDNG